MNARDCRTVRREIDTSELGQRLSAPLEMHLAECAACAQFRTDRAQLRELVGSLKPVAAPADFDMRLRARIAREKDAGARQPFIFRFALTTPGIAVAALVVLAIAQMIVHLIFFLHITTAPAQKTNILALLLTLLIISLVVIGSLWIMAQLATHMVPMDQLMQMQR